MRILACSDIHGNVEAVRKIRDLEANIFDVIVIAGDIGNGNTGDVLSCFGSFGCPVLYVYGNWDNKVSYDVSFSPGFNHIHNNLICIDGYYFGGYSGCSASWGMNPIYLDLLRDVNERHKETIRIRNELRFDFDRQESAIHADFLERMRLLKEQRHKLTLAEYRKKRLLLGIREDKSVSSARNGLASHLLSAVHRSYICDRSASIRSVGEKNLEAFSRLIVESQVDQRRLIMVTHDRIYRIGEHNLQPLVYIFGHLHRHKLSRSGGTSFVNVAAVDMHDDMTFYGCINPDEFFDDDRVDILEKRYKNRPCGYCILELRGADVAVFRKEII